MTARDDQLDPLDEATRKRLRSLGSMPVDLSRLSKSIHAAIPRNTESQSGRFSLWLRPLRVAAASVVFLGVVIALVLAVSTGPALASPERLAAIHAEATQMHMSAPVTTIAEANQRLKSEWSAAPDVPAVDGHEVRSCCLHHLDNKRLACVTLQIENTPVTFAVADAADVKCPHAKMVNRNGVQFCVMSSGELNIIMWVHQNRWASLVSKLPSDKLLDAAERIQF